MLREFMAKTDEENKNRANDCWNLRSLDRERPKKRRRSNANRTGEEEVPPRSAQEEGSSSLEVESGRERSLQHWFRVLRRGFTETMEYLWLELWGSKTTREIRVI